MAKPPVDTPGGSIRNVACGPNWRSAGWEHNFGAATLSFLSCATTDPILQQFRDALRGAYVIERELGGGGMSRVFVARETALDRLVAIKVLPADLMAGVSVERFRREIQVAARLQHAHIVPVLTAGEVNGAPYYTMPFVQGESLREHMTTHGPLPVAEVISIARDMARALAVAHTFGIAHRDIKPENVLLSGGAAMIADFGIAKAISASRVRDPDEERSETLTQIGVSLGTPAYMAPEQAAADPTTDHRADLYAFGVVLYEMLAGRPLFDARAAHDLVTAHMGQAPVPISTRRPDTPRALAELVMRCLSKNPEDRPQSAEAVLAALDATAAPSALRGDPVRTLAVYAAAFVTVALAAHFAITRIGLPTWVFPTALLVMALGLPAMLLLSPRQSMRGGLGAIGALVLTVAGYMLLRALGIGPVGSLFAKGVLKENDRVVISDFRAVHADSTFAAMIGEEVRTGLSQSGAIYVVSDSDVRAELRLMRRDPAAPVDLSAARGAAARWSAKAVVDGDVAGVSGGYLVSVRLIGTENGQELASFHAMANGPQALIEAADKLVREVRAKIGESLRTVNAMPALYDQTTSSIDALREFTLAVQSATKGNLNAAVGHYREAVHLDTAFAVAWANLGSTLQMLGLFASADSARGHSYALRDRLSRWEQLYVTGSYLGFPYQRDPVKAASAFQQLVDDGDSSELGDLATLRLNQRDYAGAEPLFRAAMQRDPNGSTVEPLNLIAVLFNEGKVVEAESMFVALRRRAPSALLIPRWAAELAYQRGDLSLATRIADSLRTSSEPAQRVWGAHRMADLALLHGEVEAYGRYSREASAVNAARGNPDAPLSDSIAMIYTSIWMDASPAHGLARLDAALAHPALDTSLDAGDFFRAAGAYAIGGRIDRARAMLARYDAVSTDSIERRLDEPDRHWVLGEIALTEKRWTSAVAEIRRSDTTVTGLPSGTCRMCVYAWLGDAFDRAGMADSAIVMYEAYLRTPLLMRGVSRMSGIGTDSYWTARVYRRLGALYEQKGDRTRALADDGRFVDLWKRADPELQPLVTVVRTRVEALKSAK
ncbi:MAG TPA: protein kinase [Gemmatimonadaceae bacterium]